MAKINLLVDNFDDNSRNTSLWNVGNHEGLSQTGLTVSETNGRLQISLPVSQSGSNYSGYISATTHDLSSSEMYVRLVQRSSTFGGAETSFCAFTDATHRLEFYTDGANLRIAYRNGSTSNTELAALTYDSTTHAWLRIREASGTVYFDTAASTANDPPTSGQWTNRASVATPFSVTAVTAGMIAGTWQSVASPGTAIFDGFNTGTSGANTAALSKTLVATTVSSASVARATATLTKTLAASTVSSSAVGTLQFNLNKTLAATTSSSAAVAPSSARVASGFGKVLYIKSGTATIGERRENVIQSKETFAGASISGRVRVVSRTATPAGNFDTFKVLWNITPDHMHCFQVGLDGQWKVSSIDTTTYDETVVDTGSVVPFALNAWQSFKIFQAENDNFVEFNGVQISAVAHPTDPVGYVGFASVNSEIEFDSIAGCVTDFFDDHSEQTFVAGNEFGRWIFVDDAGGTGSGAGIRALEPAGKVVNATIVSSTAIAPATADLSKTLQPTTLSSQAGQSKALYLDKSLAATTSSSTASMGTITASFSKTLQATTGAISATATATASLSKTLNPAVAVSDSLASAGFDLSSTLAPTTVESSASGTVGPVLNATMLPTLLTSSVGIGSTASLNRSFAAATLVNSTASMGGVTADLSSTLSPTVSEATSVTPRFASLGEGIGRAFYLKSGDSTIGERRENVWQSYDAYNDCKIAGKVRVLNRTGTSPQSNETFKVLWAKSPSHMYTFQVDMTGTWRICSVDLLAYNEQVLANGSVAALELGKWYSFDVAQTGTQIVVKFNGAQVSSISNSRGNRGYVGLASVNSEIEFDNIAGSLNDTFETLTVGSVVAGGRGNNWIFEDDAGGTGSGAGVRQVDNAVTMLAPTTLFSSPHSPLSASLSKTLNPTTVSSAAVLSSASASLSKTLNPTTGSSTTSNPLSATLSKSISPTTSSSSAKVSISAAVSKQLASSTVTSTTSLSIQAALTKSLAPTTASSSIVRPAEADLAKTLAPTTVSSESKSTIQAELTRNITATTVSSSVGSESVLDLQRSLAASTVSSTAAMGTITGTVQRSLESTSVSSTAISPVAATLTKSFNPTTGSSTFTTSVGMNASPTIKPTTSSIVTKNPIQADASPSMLPTVSASTYTSYVIISASPTIKPTTSSGSTSSFLRANAAPTILAATSASEVQARLQLAASLTMAQTVSSSQVENQITLNQNFSIAPTQVVSTATMPATLDSSNSLAPSTVSSFSTSTVGFSASSTLAPTSVSSEASSSIIAVSSKTLAATTVNGIAISDLVADSANTLRATTSSGQIEKVTTLAVDKSLNATHSSSTVRVGISGQVLASLQPSSVASEAMASPGITLVATLADTTVSCDASMPLYAVATPTMSGTESTSFASVEILADAAAVLSASKLLSRMKTTDSPVLINNDRLWVVMKHDRSLRVQGRIKTYRVLGVNRTYKLKE